MTATLKLNTERGAGVAIVLLMALAPLVLGAYWVSFILTQTFLIGIAACVAIGGPAIAGASERRADGEHGLGGRLHRGSGV